MTIQSILRKDKSFSNYHHHNRFLAEEIYKSVKSMVDSGMFNHDFDRNGISYNLHSNIK